MHYSLCCPDNPGCLFWEKLPYPLHIVIWFQVASNNSILNTNNLYPVIYHQVFILNMNDI